MQQRNVGRRAADFTQTPLPEKLDIEEIRTYRQGVERLLTANFEGVGERILTQEQTLQLRVDLARTEAREANDTLERYIIAKAEALTSLTDNRFETTQQQLKECEHMTRELVTAAENSSVSRYNSLKEQLKVQYDLGQIAINKAETANERRFDSVNDLRQLMSDQQSRQMTRAEIQALINPIQENAQKLEQRVTQNEGRNRGSSAAIGYVVVGITLLVSLMGLAISFLHR